MPYAKTQGMNKEKLVFYLSLLMLGVSGFLFVRSWPGTLQVESPVTRKARPVMAEGRAFTPYLEVALAPNEERKSPFMADQQWRQMNTKTKPDITKAPPPPPPAPPKAPEQPKVAKQPTEKDLEVGFMGIVNLNGVSYALLASKDGSPPRRVKEGETIEGLNYTITKIEKQAIHLTDADGRPYVLKDGRFSDVAAGGSSSGATGFSGNLGKTPKQGQPAPKQNPPNPTPPSKSPPKAFPQGPKTPRGTAVGPDKAG